MLQVKHSLLLVFCLALTHISDSRIIERRNKRMINGKAASIGEWPFIASLKYSSSARVMWKICSASLITRKWLVTVAHCVKDRTDTTINARDLTVQLRIRNDSWQRQDYAVSEIVVHSIQNAGDMLEGIENDIALIMLTEEAPGHMTTVNMHQQGPGAVSQCKSAGWGSTSQLQNGGDDVNSGNYVISSSLQEISVPDLAEWKSCDFLSSFGRRFDMNKDHKFFCGGKTSVSNNKGQYGCIGDSGSPLICQNSSEYVLHGLVDGGNANCIPGSAHMVFIDVGKHRQWINEVILSKIS